MHRWHGTAWSCWEQLCHTAYDVRSQLKWFSFLPLWLSFAFRIHLFKPGTSNMLGWHITPGLVTCTDGMVLRGLAGSNYVILRMM